VCAQLGGEFVRTLLFLFRSCPFLFRSCLFLFHSPVFYLSLLAQLEIGQEPLAIQAEQAQVAGRHVEANSQARTHPAVHVGDLDQSVAGAPITLQRRLIRIVNVIFLDPIFLIKLEFPEHLRVAIAGQEDLEHDLRWDAALLPLLVPTAIAFLAAEGDQGVRRGPNLRMALLGIPLQVARDENVLIVTKHSVQAALDRRDPLELQGVLGHGLTITIRVTDKLRSRSCWEGTHNVPRWEM
jgi:hypothetical protein